MPSMRSAAPGDVTRARPSRTPARASPDAEGVAGTGFDRPADLPLHGHSAALDEIERGQVRLPEERRPLGEGLLAGDLGEVEELAGGGPREERARLQEVGRSRASGERGPAAGARPAPSSGPQDRAAGAEHGAEEGARQVGVLSQQGQQLLDAEGQAEGVRAGLDRLRQPLAAEHRLQPEGERRLALGGLGPVPPRHHAALEQEVDLGRRGALPAERLPGLGAHRAGRPREADERVHGHEGQQGHTAQAVHRLHGGQRLPPPRAPALGGDPAGGQGPGRRLEDEPVPRVAVGQHVLEVVGQPPQPLRPHVVDGGGGEHLVLVVDELGERVREVPPAGPQQGVRPLHLLLGRDVLEQRHQPLAQGAAQEVVEVLGGAGAGPGVALHPAARRGHVAPREDEAEEAPDPLARALQPLLEDAVEQRPAGRPRAPGCRAGSGRGSGRAPP